VCVCVCVYIMKRNNYSYKMWYERYLELICKCLSHDMYTELTRIRILYEEITCVYKKAHVIVM